MDGIQQLQKTFGAMIARTQNPRPALNEIAPMLGSEIIENFTQQGRPVKWKKSKRAERQGGETLKDTGRLMKEAAVPQVENDTITFGSTLPYAAIHQFGFDEDITVGDKIRRMKMPVRSYLFFSDESLSDAGRIIADYASTGRMK